MYYLQSRYYNPEWGRFINADALISTGQGPLGNNMFAYCNNNPVIYIDSSGKIPVWVGALVAVVACGIIIGIDHYLAKKYPDGREGYREDNGNGCIEKYMYAEGGGFKCDKNGLSLCDLNVGLCDIFYQKDNLRIGFFNVISGRAEAELDWSGIVPSFDVSVLASIYSADVEYKASVLFFDVTISGALHVGAIGGGLELDPNSGEIKYTVPGCGVIPTIGIDVDLAS